MPSAVFLPHVFLVYKVFELDISSLRMFGIYSRVDNSYLDWFISVVYLDWLVVALTIVFLGAVFLRGGFLAPFQDRNQIAKRVEPRV